MYSWATCFKLLPLVSVVVTSAAEAQVRYTQEQALRLAFPPEVSVERRTAFLSGPQLESVRGLAGPDVTVDQRVLTYYVGTRDRGAVGVAYFDAHRVRTLNEVLMVVVDTGGAVVHVEVLAFAEPPEYLPPDTWLAQLEGRRLSDALSLKGDIVTMTGATLTSQAVVRAVRRVLAYHAVIRPFVEEAR